MEVPTSKENCKLLRFTCLRMGEKCFSSQRTVECCTPGEAFKGLSHWPSTKTLSTTCGVVQKPFKAKQGTRNVRDQIKLVNRISLDTCAPIGKRTLHGVHVACSNNRTRPRSSRLACSSIFISGKDRLDVDRPRWRSVRKRERGMVRPSLHPTSDTLQLRRASRAVLSQEACSKRVGKGNPFVSDSNPPRLLGDRSSGPSVWRNQKQRRVSSFGS